LYEGDAGSRSTGKERDAESGNDYFMARYYSSSMGRFMSPDPIFGEADRVLDPQQWNMYAYAGNNPLMNTDPTGLDFNLTCSGGNTATCQGGLQGQTTTDANGKSTFAATDIDMNKQGDPSAGYSDQFGNNYTGTFDQNNGVSFTNTATGDTSSHSQFIDGSDPTQLIGAQGSAFGGMKANFFDACGSSSSCQGRFTLYGTKDQFNTMESTLHKQGGMKTFLDGFSGAHPFNADQWKGGGPNNNYVHMIKAPGFHMDGHFEGSTDAGLHAFSTIKDLADGDAAGERGKLVPGSDY
jgi:RHS repeat-associated protein